MARLKAINSNNILGEAFRPGRYVLYDSHKRPIYTGSSRRVRHRLEALLYGRSDYATVATKRALRMKARYYHVIYNNNVRFNRCQEKKYKARCAFNKC